LLIFILNLLGGFDPMRHPSNAAVDGLFGMDSAALFTRMREPPVAAGIGLHGFFVAAIAKLGSVTFGPDAVSGSAVTG